MAEQRSPSDKQKQQRPHLSESWWRKNQDILQYLYEERPVPEIARLVSRTEEQVRKVQEQLEGLRRVELNSADTMLILKYLPHPRVEYPPDILEEFERLMDQIESEELDENEEPIRDASTNLDKYIYG